MPRLQDTRETELDTLDQQKRSPTPGDRQIQVSQMLTEPRIRRETTPSGLISLKTSEVMCLEKVTIFQIKISVIYKSSGLRIFLNPAAKP